MWVKIEDYAFLVHVEYKNLSLLYSQCYRICHVLFSCNLNLNKVHQEKVVPQDKTKRMMICVA